MAAAEIDVKYVAHLARISLSPDEEQKLSAQLGNAGLTASKLETTATITLDKLPDGFGITKSHLDLVAHVPGADKSKFEAAVKAAETGCPVSKLFKAEISVTARLES